MLLFPTTRKARGSELAAFDPFERFFENVTAGFPALATNDGVLFPVTDILEDDKSVTISVELPGVRPGDVKLSLQNEVLTLSAEKRQESTEKNGRGYRLERSFGKFERRFNLPGTIDTDRIEATQKDGVLRVVLPKSERAVGREIEVQEK